ncbi:MAG: hypothetical protein KY475_11600 [Planctomycetes bacterium]|nr:hypothetical protein [Planctomycetota bacterium]
MLADPVLQIGERVTALPIIHGSGDFALEVRRRMLRQRYDCVAVPLPPSFQADVEAAIAHLPAPAIVAQRAAPRFLTEWSPELDDDDDSDDEPELSYVTPSIERFSSSPNSARARS